MSTLVLNQSNHAQQVVEGDKGQCPVLDLADITEIEIELKPVPPQIATNPVALLDYLGMPRLPDKESKALMSQLGFDECV